METASTTTQRDCTPLDKDIAHKGLSHFSAKDAVAHSLAKNINPAHTHNEKPRGNK